MTDVLLSHLTKHYSGRKSVVDDLSLEIPAGKLTALLGPSGCGKTTILKMIAGLISPSSGDIHFDGASVLGVPAERRGAVMVFQNHLLFPYLSVAQNVAFGLKMRGKTGREIDQKVARMLDLVQLGGYENNMPGRLSGGEQQRVALARALIVEPRVLLLDEPLSNLDASLRDEMRDLIYRLQRHNGITTIVVTHDQEEAVMLSDRLALIFKGVLQQVDTPRAFYERPANLEVARFFGAKNFFSGVMVGDVIQTHLGVLRVAKNQLPPGPVDLSIRPERIQILSDHTPAENVLKGMVELCTFTGTRTLLKIRTRETIVEVVTDSDATGVYREGDLLKLYLPPESIWVFPTGSTGRID